MNVIRETGEWRPRPEGEWDGTTRASLMRDLLGKDELERQPLPVAPQWWRRLLWLSVILCATEAGAQTRHEQALAVLTASVPAFTARSATPAGPRVIIIHSGGAPFGPLPPITIRRVPPPTITFRIPYRRR